MKLVVVQKKPQYLWMFLVIILVAMTFVLILNPFFKDSITGFLQVTDDRAPDTWNNLDIIVTNQISNPPTELELEKVIGSPGNQGIGRGFIINDIGTNTYYHVVSIGPRYIFQPMSLPFASEGAAAPSPFLDIVNSAGWCWFADPRAVFYNGKTYLGWVSSSGHAMAASLLNTTGQVSEPFNLHNVGRDDHNNPTVLVRNSDKRVLYFFTGHDSAGMYARISTNPEDVSSFGSSIDISTPTGGGLHTYPTPVQLVDESGEPIYLFWRGRSDVNATTY